MNKSAIRIPAFFIVLYLILMGSILNFYIDTLSSYNKSLATTTNKISGVEYLKLLHQLSVDTINMQDKNIIRQPMFKNIKAIYAFQKSHPKYNNPKLNNYLKSIEESKINYSDYFKFFDFINHEKYNIGNTAELLFSHDKQQYVLGTLITHYIPEFFISLGISRNILNEYIPKNRIDKAKQSIYIEHNKLVYVRSSELYNIINSLSEYDNAKGLTTVISKIQNRLKLLKNSRNKLIIKNPKSKGKLYDYNYDLRITQELLVLSEELYNENKKLLEHFLKNDKKYYSDKIIFYKYLFIFKFILITGLFIYFYRILKLNLRHDKELEALNKSLVLRVKELDEAKEIAVTANQSKSQFLTSMSHELRTPMNAILGFAQIMKFDDDLKDEQQESIHEILKAGNHLLELINEILDLAKIESGRIELSLESVDLSELIEECFTLINPVAEQYGISVSHGEIKNYFIQIDKVRFKQVLINLLSNAVKYNREQGSVVLNAVLVKNDSAIRITVNDTGHGIPKDHLKDLFIPFNRLNAENSNIEGTGIGLSITRNLIELMDGSIGVDSEVGVGSCFWIELPMNTSSYIEKNNDTNEVVIDDSLPINKEQQNTVLYIEDNPANLKLVSRILGKLKHINLIPIHEAKLAMELAIAHQPDLILLDINMPGMDGYQVLSMLQSDEKLKGIPVVAVTANAMPNDIERGKAAGFSDYLIKPLNIEKLISIVNYYTQ